MLEKENIRQRLIYLFEEFGTNQSWLAKKLDVHQSTINKFKSGKQELSNEILARIDNFLKERGL